MVAHAIRTDRGPSSLTYTYSPVPADDSLGPNLELRDRQLGALRRVPPDTVQPALCVLDPSGMPLAGAAVARMQASQRLIPNASIIGLTDQSGLLRFASPPADELVVGLQGYITNIVDAWDSGETMKTVRLSRGEVFVARCEDINGIPISDCRVRLSTKALPLHCPDKLPFSAFGASAVHAGTSLVDGFVSFEGMLPGRYYVRAERHDFVLIDGPDSIDVPGPPVSFVLGRILLGVLVVEGDEILGSSVSVDGHAGNVPGDEFQRVMTSLAQAYPEGVAAVSIETSPETEKSAQVQVLLREGGFSQVEIPLVPMSEYSGPTTLEARELARGPPTQPIEFDVMDSTGRSLSIGGFYLTVGPNGVDPAFIEFEAGEILWLPEGSYRVRNYSPWVESGMLNQELSIPGTGAIRVNSAFRKCDMFFVDPSGEPVYGVRATVEAAGTVRNGFLEWRNPWSMWLPVGSAHVEARARGFSALAAPFEVLSDDRSVQELFFTLSDQ